MVAFSLCNTKLARTICQARRHKLLHKNEIYAMHFKWLQLYYFMITTKKKKKKKYIN